MQSNLDQFKFPKATRAFYAGGKADNDGWEFKETSFTALIEASYQDFPEFLPLYLKSDYQQHVLKLLTRHYMPDVQGKSFKGADVALGDPMYEAFNSKPIRQELREKHQARAFTTYPLTKEELENATEYLSRHGELLDAVVLLQSALRIYTKKLEMHLLDIGLFSLLRIEHNKRNSLERRFSQILGESGNFSFLHDLIPVMGASLYAQKADKIDAKAAGKALCTAFRLHTFKSFNETEIQCPFRSTLNSMFAIDISRTADGKIEVMANSYPGALIPALIAYLKDGNPDLNAGHNRDID
jgi:hypothetical protein